MSILRIKDSEGKIHEVLAIKGKDGKDGKTPEKGIDYFTPADKEKMVQDVLGMIGGVPVFGVVDSSNNIILSGNLVDGVYTLKYEDAEGNVTEIGTLNHSSTPEPTYTNLFNPDTAVLNTRMSGSTSTSKAQDGYVMTASIPLPHSVNVTPTFDENTPYIAIPASLWSGSANMFAYNDGGYSGAYMDAGTTPGTRVGDWVKVPIHNQWDNNSVTVSSMVVSLYVKSSAITKSDIQNIEIYFNECPE